MKEYLRVRTAGYFLTIFGLHFITLLFGSFLPFYTPTFVLIALVIDLSLINNLISDRYTKESLTYLLSTSLTKKKIIDDTLFLFLFHTFWLCFNITLITSLNRGIINSNIFDIIKNILSTLTIGISLATIFTHLLTLNGQLKIIDIIGIVVIAGASVVLCLWVPWYISILIFILFCTINYFFYTLTLKQFEKIDVN